jgi:mono/diheme cytochrome c family protein
MSMISRKNAIKIRFILLFGCWLMISAPAFGGSDHPDKGRALYMQHCAACHGIKGDGHGPLEHQLLTPPSDLRLLSKRYGNPLAEDQIARFMDGRADVAAHGPRDMPVWGEEMWRYPEGKGNPNQVSDSVAEIVHYLQSIQIAGRHASLEQKLPLAGDRYQAVRF